jgi:hypothetical protein
MLGQAIDRRTQTVVAVRDDRKATVELPARMPPTRIRRGRIDRSGQCWTAEKSIFDMGVSPGIRVSGDRPAGSSELDSGRRNRRSGSGSGSQAGLFGRCIWRERHA